MSLSLPVIRRHSPPNRERRFRSWQSMLEIRWALGWSTTWRDPEATSLAYPMCPQRLHPRRLELLKEIVPNLHRVAVLWNANDLGMTLRYRASEAGAQVLGVGVQPLGVREPDDFEHAFEAMNRDMPDAILMVSDSLTILNRKRVFEFAAAHRLPAIYEFDFLVREGGLMSYGPDLDESFDRVAALVDRILKGVAPAELPCEQPTLFRFALNLKTAKSIALEVPPILLVRADEVIE